MDLKLVSVPELVSKDTSSGRFYTDGEFNFPSITTILGKTGDKTGLEQWRARVGESAAEKKSQESRTVGQEVHDLMESMILGTPSPAATHRAKTMFRGLAQVAKKRLGDIFAVECPLASKTLKVAGRTDLVGVFDGHSSIIDYKSNHGTSDKKEEWILDYKLQTAFYARCWREMGLGDIRHGVLLIANVFCTQVVQFETTQYEEQLEERVRAYYSQI